MPLRALRTAPHHFLWVAAALGCGGQTATEQSRGDSSSGGTTAGGAPEGLGGDSGATGSSGAGGAAGDAGAEGTTPAACVPGITMCDGEVSLECNTRGSAFEPIEVCDLSGTCDPATGRCALSGACIPGSVSCERDVLVRCLPDAKGTVPVEDCGSANMICDVASCRPAICIPSTSRCSAAGVVTCNDKGTRERLTECSGDEQCVESGASAMCQSDVCVPDSLYCDWNVVKLCGSDGSSPIETVQDCTAVPDTICIHNACAPVICEPHRTGCHSGAKRTCNATGTGLGDSASCPGTSVFSCFSVGDVATCGVACPGATCSDETYDCPGQSRVTCARGQVCSLTAGGCVAAAVDYTDSGSYYGGAGQLLGYYYDVTQSRTLTRIEFNLLLLQPPASLTTWVVYEGAVDGVLSRAFETTAPLKVVPGETIVSSGAISVPLSSGKRYFIGIYSPDTLYTYEGAAEVAPVSFGARLAAYTQGALEALPQTLPYDVAPSERFDVTEQAVTTIAPAP